MADSCGLLGNCSIDSAILNGTANNGNSQDGFQNNGTRGIETWTVISITLYALIFVAGLLGNGLVIYVVLRFTKMKTVTNMYILNLAIADLCFIVGLPFLIATALLKQWVFGFAMCKLFYILTSINWFTSVFTLTVMSADRYLAVCYPIKSMQYRTPLASRVVCVCIWTASFLVMLPIILYTTTVEFEPGNVSCTLSWPKGQPISPEKAFIWYALLLGFAIPVALIIVFYALVLIRLKHVGPKSKSKEKKKSHRKVTRMVLTVITVYIICWLPYWLFQLILTNANIDMPFWCVHLFQIITVMSYINSMLNPVLYAFLSENFRKSFIKAFECASTSEVNAALQAEHSVFPGRKNTGTGTILDNGQANETTKNENIEFATANMTTSTKFDGSTGEDCKPTVVNHDGNEAETSLVKDSSPMI